VAQWLRGSGVASQLITSRKFAYQVLLTLCGLVLVQVFGFYAVVNRTAGSLGPLLFGLVVDWTGDEHSGFKIVIVFFIAGMWLLAQVDIKEGVAQARGYKSITRNE
jgi:hypothetical protein